MTSTTTAIVGLGMTEMGKVFGRTATQLAAQAVRSALDDAGISVNEVDGLLISSGVTNKLTLDLQGRVGLRDLSLLCSLQSFGATAGVMVQLADAAIASGSASVVVCVFADAPLREGTSAGQAYRGAVPEGWRGIRAASGIVGANSMYALAARRHMKAYGTTSGQFGAIAVAQRDWAALNPLAQMREPMSLEDHQASKLIADPLRLLDCCLVSNGAVAVVVTHADRAPDCQQPPVFVLGSGQSHPGYAQQNDERFGLVTGARESGRRAFREAGVRVKDLDVVELYDCYTYTVLVSLEDYGFCAKGEGGDFVQQSGLLGPGGRLALNTGGGQLSSYYMWGMTPLSEAIVQLRGQAGRRQVERHDLALVSGNGGVLDHHSTLILGRSVR